MFRAISKTLLRVTNTGRSLHRCLSLLVLSRAAFGNDTASALELTLALALQ